VIGYANRSVNSGSDSCRGSYNAEESGKLNNKSYKYVYDFATTQANGLISSLALTSDTAGSLFMGNELSREKHKIKRIYDRGLTYSASNTAPFTNQELFNVLAHNSIRVIDANKEIAFSCYWNNANIVINEIDFPIHNLSFMNNLNAARGRQIIKTTKLTLTNAFTENNTFFPDDYDNPKYLWGFCWKSTKNAPTNIKWIKISLETYEFEEGTWTIELPLYSCGYDYSSNYNYNNWSSSYWYSTSNCLLYNNYLYCFNYSLTGIYKISINDLSDVIFLKHPNNICHIAGNSGINHNTGPNTSFNFSNGIIYFGNGYILNDEIKAVLTPVSPDSYAQSFNYGLYCCNPGVHYKDFIFSFYGYNYGNTSNSYYYQGVYLQSHYLATINNLENPIEKTDDKTMKITYILTEVDEEGEE
jgi:hypothetical protein